MDNLSAKLNQINKLIKEGQELLALIEKSERTIAKRNDFSLTGLLGRNAIGDFVRNTKVRTINSSIDKIQEDVLKYQKNLAIYDTKYAYYLDLPYKLQEFKSSRTAISDILLRTNMRKKGLEVAKIKNRLVILIKKLIKEEKKIEISIRKQIELEEFM